MGRKAAKTPRQSGIWDSPQGRSASHCNILSRGSWENTKPEKSQAPGYPSFLTSLVPRRWPQAAPAKPFLNEVSWGLSAFASRTLSVYAATSESGLRSATPALRFLKCCLVFSLRLPVFVCPYSASAWSEHTAQNSGRRLQALLISTPDSQPGSDRGSVDTFSGAAYTFAAYE